LDQQQQAFNQVYQAREEDKYHREQFQKTKSEGRLLAINGCYDYWEKVIPHLRIKTKDLVQPLDSLSDLPAPLHSYHLIAVGCPGNSNSPEVLEGILGFLKDGGFVLTTDQCMGYILAPPDGWLGPDLVKMPNSTGSLDVDIQAPKSDHPLLRGLPAKFSWNIAGGSHLIEVVNPQKIEVLLHSSELKKTYSHGTVMFTTRVGKGTLVHFLSHAYAQTTDVQGIQAAAIILANLFDLAVADKATEAAKQTEVKTTVKGATIPKPEKPLTPWPSDKIELIKEKVSACKEKIRQGSHEGQYLIGEGFSAKLKSAAELVAMGLARRIDDGDSLQANSSPIKKDIEGKPALTENEPFICEPWPEDNIAFFVEKLKAENTPLKRSSSSKYMLGKGFTATLKTAEELIALGYAKKVK
jgi:hypothetical protein